MDVEDLDCDAEVEMIDLETIEGGPEQILADLAQLEALYRGWFTDHRATEARTARR